MSYASASLRRGSTFLAHPPRHPRVPTIQCTRQSLATEAEPVSASAPVELEFHPPEGSLQPPSDSPLRTGQTLRQGTTLRSEALDQRTVFVRPWDGVSSMPELLAMVRGIEQQYGTVREYGIARDPDLLSAYVPYFWVNFEDSASFARVPEAPSLLKVDVPVVDMTRPGGIGLDDLQGLLSPHEYVSPESSLREIGADAAAEDSAKTGKTRSVDLRLERAKLQFRVGARNVWRPINKPVVNAFYNWGGFYVPKANKPELQLPTMQYGLEQHKQRRAANRAASASHTEEGLVADSAPVDPALPTGEQHASLSTSSTPKAPEQRTPAAALADAPEQTTLAAMSPEAVMTGAETTTPISSTEPLTPSSRPHLEDRESAKVPHLSKRERILAQARLNARTPLPASVLRPEEKRKEKEEARAKEREEEDRVRSTVSEKLWKLMGGKWF